MKGVAELLSALSSLAWPALILFLVLRFSSAIRSVLESASKRKFSVKIAGNELTMEEFSEQQIKLIGDLQAKVTELDTKVPHQTAAETSDAADSMITAQVAGGKRVLWVDDKPKNNSYLAAVLEDRGNRVDEALTTHDAVRMFSSAKYDAVISDMGRPESERAGLDLTDRIRSLDMHIPILIFCGDWAARNFKDEAAEHRVSFITSSPAKLLAALAGFGIS